MPTHYDAFISYSHTADGKLAPAVQTGLQRLARSWRSVRALKVFRDETGLSVNPHLWTSIQEALEHSRYFVLMASPDAARSEWVNREIECWLTEMAGDRILPVLTEGELVWDEARNDFDHEASTAIPPALFGRLTEEPRYLDLRWAHDDTQLTIRNSRFREAIADLAAPMHGISKDELQSEDVRQYRHRVRLARAAVSAVALLAVVSVIAAIIALAARSHANELTRAADVRRIAAESLTVRASQSDLARLLAVEAFRRSDTVETRGALQQAVLASLPARTLVPSGTPVPATGPSATAISGDGRIAAGVVVQGTSGATIVVLDTRNGRTVKDLPVPDASLLALDEHGDRLAYASSVGGLHVVDRRTGAALLGDTAAPGAVSTPSAVAFDAAGSRVAVADAQGVDVFDVTSGVAVGPTIPLPPSLTTSPIALSPDGRLVAVAEGQPIAAVPNEGPSPALTGAAPQPSAFVSGGGPGTVGLWDVASGGAAPLAPGAGFDGSATSLAFSPRGDRLAVAAEQSGTTVFDLGGQGSRTVPGVRAAFASDGTLVTIWADGTVTRFDAATGRQRGAPASVTAGASATDTFTTGGGPIAWSAPASLVTGGTAITVWNAAGADMLARRALGLSGANVVGISSDGRRIAIRVHPQFSQATASLDADVTAVYDTGTGRQIGGDVPGTVSTYALVARGTRVLGLGADGSTPGAGFTLYGFPGLRPVATVQPPSGSGFPSPSGVADAPDGKKFAFGIQTYGTLGVSSDAVWIADARTGKLLGAPIRLGSENAFDATSALAFSADGRRLLALAPSLAEPVLIDVTHRKVVPIPAAHRFPVSAAAYSPDGRTLALGVSGGVDFVDATTFAPLGIPWQEPGVVPSSLTFSADGRSLAVGVSSATTVLASVRVVDVASRTTIGGAYPSGPAAPAAFTSRAATLVATGPGGVIRWSLDPDVWVRSACAAVGHNLSRADWNRYLPAGDDYRRTCPRYPDGP